MNINNTYNTFSTTKGNFTTRDFFQSNSIIAKIAFLLLVIFLFIIFLRLGISLLAYFLKPNDNPKLINGMVDATQMLIFYQDPSYNNSVTINRSINENEGIEFTWSIWIYINNLQSNPNMYKHIFSKGNSDIDASSGIIQPNNAPGLYIAPNKNDLVVIMNTFNVINEEIIIPNIPINKWVNVIIRCKNTSLDVYINGTIARSINLIGVPKQNFGDVYVAMNGGFNGYISNLYYYNYALNLNTIQNILYNGPNTKMIGSNAIINSIYDYLSLRWYFYGSGDAYNPTIST